MNSEQEFVEHLNALANSQEEKAAEWAVEEAAAAVRARLPDARFAMRLVFCNEDGGIADDHLMLYKMNFDQALATGVTQGADTKT